MPTPADLAIYASRGRWKLTPHLALLNEALVWLSRREAPAGFLRRIDPKAKIDPGIPDDEMVPFLRLIVEMPPRHGKSELVSHYFPPWYIGTHPQHRVILCSYEANFARKWGRLARDVIRRYGLELFGLRINRGTDAGNDWGLDEHDGGMITAGVGGPITGQGANLGIIDDAVKNAQEAASPVIQQRNNDWFDSTWYTRLEPDAIALVMGTRWNAGDLTGHVLKTQEDDEEGERRDPATLDEEVWYRLTIPALAEAGDVLGREPGEALWPDRYPVGRLQRIARRIGSYFFGALYQQRPSSEEGNIFKRGDWQYYDTFPEGQHNVGYTIVDTAGWEEQSGNDYACIATVVKVGRDLYWKHAERGYWSFPQAVQKCLDARDEHGYPILIEKVPWALPLIQTLQKQISGVVPFEIKGQSKFTRAVAGQPYHEGGNFFLPRRARWVGPFVEEHAEFPNSDQDGWVDTTSMAVLRMLVGAKAYEPPPSYDLNWGAPAPPPVQTPHQRELAQRRSTSSRAGGKTFGGAL